MNIQKHSSGVAKAGLATGIVGSSLGVLNMLGSGANIIGNMAGCNNRCVAPNPWNNGWDCCSDNIPVTRYDAQKDARIAQLETEKALRDANTYADEKNIELYKDINGRLREIERQLCVQEVQNQKTSDSFQIVTERMDCLRRECCNEIAQERSERRCADNTIVNYVNATFYPKQVANVTTGTTTTAQTLYNPLPAQSPDCC